MLAGFGPWPAFLAAFAIESAAIVPLLRVSEPPFAREVPGSLYDAGKSGIWLFFSDGWITSNSATAWSIVMFRAAGARFDTFGGLLAAAALAGALSGMLLGRFIDRGHALRLTQVNAAILAATLALKAICGEGPIPVIVVAICTTMLGGLYIPTPDDRGLQRGQGFGLSTALPVCRGRRMGCRRYARLSGLGRHLRSRPAASARDPDRDSHGALAVAAAGDQLWQERARPRSARPRYPISAAMC
ncbi:MAG TPA: hypothetical protein VGI22_26095 [Xanthobacteraceae bacterium]